MALKERLGDYGDAGELVGLGGRLLEGVTEQRLIVGRKAGGIDFVSAMSTERQL